MCNTTYSTKERRWQYQTNREISEGSTEEGHEGRNLFMDQIYLIGSEVRTFIPAL